jgi:hypothetical protein
MRSAWIVALALAGCGGMYFSDFTVDAAEPSYTAREQFDDIKRYALERGLHVTGEGAGFAKFELDAANALEMRLDPDRVQLTLVRISSGAGFSEAETREFENRLEARLRERGRNVRVRFVGERERPRSNVTFPGGGLP